MTKGYRAITVAVLLVAFQISGLEAGDTEIWPIPTECPAVDPLNYTVHLQHESDCTKFYKCDHGERVLFDCPDTLHFNPVLQVCDWPEQAGCTIGQQSTSAPNPEPPNRDPECPWPDPLDHTVHLPHEDDCTKFYKCDNGVKVEFQCNDGLHFNKELGVCDWAWNAGCDDSYKTTTAAPTPKPTSKATPKPTPKPTPPPNKDPDCPWPDPLNYTVHLPHEDDCTKFYKCDNGIKVEFDCPDDLHFNKELEVCDWPWDAGCDDSYKTPKPTSKPTKPTTPKPTPPPNKDPDCPWPDPLNYTVHLPHEDDCTKFYKCDNGIKVEFDCPDDLHFNKELEVCDWPWDAGCDDSYKTPKPTSKPTNPTTPKPTPPPNKDPDCPWPDPLNYTVHLPHEDDCTKFYKCDNGIKVEFDCPDDLHFNKELEVCDWPWDAGCDDSYKTPKPTSKPTKPTNKPTKPTTPKPTPPPNKDPDCPWPDPLNYTVHLPHEDDCTKFYKCDNGIKVEFDCPDDLHFNKELEVCDWPWDAGCDDSYKTPKPTSKPTKPTNKPTKPTTPKPTPPPNKDPDCPWPDPLNYTVHLPHEDDCTKFYKCDNGVKVEFDCPDDLHFNKELEVCDWPWDAGCDDSYKTPKPTSKPTKPTNKPTKPTTPKPTPPPNKDPDCPWPDPLNYTVHLPHEDDCTKFYKCDNGIKVEFDCPDDLHFNKELEVCDWPWDAGCDDSYKTPKPTSKPTKPTNKPTKPTTPKPTPPPNKDPDCPWPDPLNYTVHLPHEDDCTKFYKCDNGVKVEFDCPDDLHFNKELEVCDWPWDAGCDDSYKTPKPTSKPTKPTTPKPTPKPTSKPTKPTNKPTKPTTPKPTPPPNKDPDCPWPDPLNYTVHLPHEDDCTKFYKCDNGIKVEFDCPDDLHFNKELEVCDWPWDAGCDDSYKTPKPTSKPTKPTSKPTKPTTPKPTPPPNKDPDCPWPDPLNYTVHLPHEDDCTKFYKCDNGIKVEFDCPDDLHFNKELEVCDWPWDAGCDDSYKTTTAAPTQPPNPCPNVECQDATIYLPVLSNPRKYIRCVNGKEVVATCPSSLVFDPKLATCNLEHLVEAFPTR
ncbi:cell surface glycoprotein 1-like isoform X2 [Zophobas morio]|uniref:cell surface glycoprotein 1-like isoform X2 n=1 Tax=Zophobas morio TaxID=2755281 RepID=UPI003082BC53